MPAQGAALGIESPNDGSALKGRNPRLLLRPFRAVRRGHEIDPQGVALGWRVAPLRG
jgi:hypothetical protein